MKKIVFSISLILLFLFIGCNGSNPLVGQKYEGGDSLWEKEYSIIFHNNKYCTLNTIFDKTRTIDSSLIYKIDNKEDLLGRYEGKLFYAQDKEPFGTLYYAKDGSWVSIQSSSNYVNSVRLRRQD